MQRTSRIIAAAAAMAIPMGLFLALLFPQVARGAADRSFVSAKFLLEVDLGAGKKVSGYVKSVSGGNLCADVVDEKMGPDYIVRKHVTAPKYEAFVFKIRPGAFPELMPLVRTQTRINGAVTSLNFDNKPVSKREFGDALLTRLELPALDGASKEPAYMTMVITPTFVRAAPADAAAAPVIDALEQKLFLPANFRVVIPGLETTKISKVDPFVATVKPAKDAVGDARDAMLVPARLDFPNVKLQVAAVQAKTWTDWLDDFVLKGNNGQDKEKTMRVEFLAADLKEALLVLEAKGVGILAARQMTLEANADQIARIEVELYIEEWQIVTSGGAPATPPATAPAAPTGVVPRTLAPKIRG